MRNVSSSRVGQREWCFLTLSRLLLEPREKGGAAPSTLLENNEKDLAAPSSHPGQPHKGEAFELGLAVPIGVH